jgi:hypothetical protein
MKFQKLVIFMCMFFLLNAALVFSADFDPIFTKFEAVSTNVAETATINIQAYDGGTNPGILWLRLYEDGALFSEKNCGGLTACSWQVQVDHPEGGTFSYYAQAKDKGGNSKTSNTIQITYTGKTLSTCSLVFDPTGIPTAPLYGTPVNASCSCDNPEANEVLYRNGLDVTAAENNQFVVLEAATHDYICNVTATANYTNATTGSVMYVVDPAPTILNLTSLPSWTEFEGTQTTVSCAADNAEVSVELYRDSALVANPDVQTLTNGTYVYDCNATASQNYTAAVPVANILTVNVVPPVNVLWNSPTLNMGSTFQGVPETDFENITATGANNNVNVGCVSGDCSVIADLWVDGVSMADGETQQIDFTCNSVTVGNYSAFFEVVSTEFPAGNQINVSCDVIPTPPVTVSWNSAILDLGSGDRGAGVLTGSENITTIDDHTNVTVVCNTGNCLTITDDWTDGTGMLDAESQAVTFTCNDSTAGVYFAEFVVTSNEDVIVDSIDVSCNITIPILTTGNVLINEFLAINSTPGDDWVELYNNDTNAINLTGWYMNDSSSATAMPTNPALDGIVLYPGDFLYLDVNNRLTDGGETIDLIDSTSTTVDSYTYGPAQPDISIGRYPDGTSTWLNMTTPTPGASNLPDIYVIWDTTALNLGTGDQGAGALTGTSNITAEQANNNVVVSCTSGDCR